MKLTTANSKQQKPIAFYLHLSLFYLLPPTYTNSQVGRFPYISLDI